MKPEPDTGRWAIPYTDHSGDEFAIEYDALTHDMFGGGPGLVRIERISTTIEWPIDKIDWLVDRLTAAKVAMEEVQVRLEDEA